ncbi:MAG: hypothetical protein IKU27_04005, partial [Clostridia bacterium]|nr:hypothetical protein [Clostridia bacterium]
MKTSKTLYRALSLMLCCIMALGLLPTTALAANTTIDRVNVQIDTPMAGEAFDFEGETATYECRAGLVRWWDTTNNQEMNKNSVAQAGRRYKVEITVYANSGYTFNLYDTAAAINNFYAEKTGGTAALYLTAYYEVSAPIREVELEMEIPVPGAAPDFFPVCGSSSYMLSNYFDDYFSSTAYTYNGVQWVNTTTKKVMGRNDTFSEGSQYQAIIHLKAANGQSFYYDGSRVPPVTATI